MVYKGVAPNGITQCLASTKDFVNWRKHGIIFCPENMDAMIFPEKVRGKYVALHRPQPQDDRRAEYVDRLLRRPAPLGRAQVAAGLHVRARGKAGGSAAARCRS